jgi:hypothetical protein
MMCVETMRSRGLTTGSMSASSVIRWHVSKNLLLSPLVLAADLLLLLGSKVVLDVERLANLLGGLALDHVGHGLAADIEKGLDVHVVGSLSQRSACVDRGHVRVGVTYENDLKEHLLVNLHELDIPLLNVGGLLASVGVFVLLWGRVLLVVVAPLDDLAQNGLGDLEAKREDQRC